MLTAYVFVLLLYMEEKRIFILSTLLKHICWECIKSNHIDISMCVCHKLAVVTSQQHQLSVHWKKGVIYFLMRCDSYSCSIVVWRGGGMFPVIKNNSGFCKVNLLFPTRKD
jgi:hypothetical protein